VDATIEPIAPRVAVGVIVLSDDKILLVQRNKAPSKGTWSIPGGSVELGETLKGAAEREIKEETGLTVAAKDPVHVFDLIEWDDNGQVRFHYVIVDLMADYIVGEVTPADDALDAGWFSADDLQVMDITSSTRALLKRLQFLV
jgi:ADP-ribose pyrophosphatase